MVLYREAAVLGRRNRWSRMARLNAFDWRVPLAIAATGGCISVLLTGVSVASQIVLPIQQSQVRAPSIGKPENTIGVFLFGRAEQACGEALSFKTTDRAVLSAIAQTQVVRIAPAPSSRRYFTARVEVVGDVVRLAPRQICEGPSFKPGVIETGASATNILARLISSVQEG